MKCNAHVSVCPFDFKVLHDWFHSWLLWDKPHWDKKSDETKSQTRRKVRRDEKLDETKNQTRRKVRRDEKSDETNHIETKSLVRQKSGEMKSPVRRKVGESPIPLWSMWERQQANQARTNNSGILPWKFQSISLMVPSWQSQIFSLLGVPLPPVGLNLSILAPKWTSPTLNLCTQYCAHA